MTHKANTDTAKRTGRLWRALCVIMALVLMMGLIPSLGLQRAYAADAYLSVGDKIAYGGYNTHYMSVGGQVAFCGEPNKATPPSGTYTKSTISPVANADGKVWDKRYVASALWFGYGGPGFDKSMWPSKYYNGANWTNDNYLAMTHVILADFYSCNGTTALKGCSSGFKDWAGDTMLEWYEDHANPGSVQRKMFERWGEVPAAFRDNCFEMSTGSGTQVVLGSTPGGWIDLQKESANKDMTNGSACYSLAGAVYGVYSNAACTSEVTTITTNASGYAKSGYLGTGTYYVKEKTAPKGYALDTASYRVSVANGGTSRVNGSKVYDQPQNDPAAMWAGKIDLETTLNMPLGSASLAGAEFTARFYNDIYDTVEDAEASGVPTRTWVVRTNENGYAQLDDEFFVSGDEFYRGSSGQVTIPLGTLLIQETKPPTGYLLNDDSVYLRTVTSDGYIESVETYDIPIIKEQVYRGDLEFVKGRESDQNRLAYIPFKLTSLTTGEAHVLVTDANGEVKTQSSWNAHTENVNASDAALNYDGTIDESKLDPFAGIWFYGTSDAEHQHLDAIDNAHGALPYDTYTIEELPVAKNDGLTLISMPLTVYRDNYTINMGTLDNQAASEAGIFTFARNAQGGTKFASADTATALIDRVQYTNLDISGGVAYELHATLMDAQTGEAVVDAQGDPVTGEARFVPTSPNGTAEVTLTFDSRDYANRDVVFFEELWRADGGKVAEHKDLTDYEQTIRIVGQALVTKAVDAADGDDVISTDTSSRIIDTVTYRNLVPGDEYVLTGTLWARNIEMTAEGTEISVEPVLDADGNQVSSVRAFAPEYADGDIEVPFTLDTTELTNRSIVVFEELTRGGEHIAAHTDAYDEDQCVIVRAPILSTQATDAADGDSVIAADRKAQLIDTVDHDNVTPGNEYKLVGTLMVKGHEVREDGTKVAVANPLLDADGNPVTAEATFTPESSKDTVQVAFDFDAADLDGKELVVYEKLYRGDKEVACHEDPTDEGQSFVVRSMAIDTELKDELTDNHTVTANSEASMIDTVAYNDAVIGAGYTAYGILMDPATGLPVMQYADGKPVDKGKLADFACALANAMGVTVDANGANGIFSDLAPYPHGVNVKQAAELLEANPELAERLVWTKAEYVAEGTYGLVELNYKMDARDLEGTKATSCVLIVRDDPYEATSGEMDLASEMQTIDFVAPEIGTYATDKTDGDKVLIVSADAVVADEVKYTGLTPGKEYVLEGILYDKATGEPLLVDDKQATAEKSFVAAASEGSEIVDIAVDATSLSGHDLVVYEYLYREMETPSGVSERVKVAEHADIDSGAQTVTIEGPMLPGTGYDKTSDVLPAIVSVALLLGLLGAAGYTSTFAGRRKGAEDAEGAESAADTASV